VDVLFLALCPEHVSLRSFPPISRLPSTVSSTGTMQLSDSSHVPRPPFGGRGPKPNTGDLDHVRSPRFRRVPAARDVALDPGGTAPSRIARAYILPSMYSTISASATLHLSWLTPTPHAVAVYASHPPSPATTQHSLRGGRYPLPRPDFHRLEHASFPGALSICSPSWLR